MLFFTVLLDMELYINDLPNSVPGGKIKLFADDTNLFVSVKTTNELESKVNSYLSARIVNIWNSLPCRC